MRPTVFAWSVQLSPVLLIQVPDGLFLDADVSRAIGESLAASYGFAEPFPHLVADNFLPDALAKTALQHFPSRALNSDRVFEMGYAGLHKRQILPGECDAPARQLFHFFNSRPVLEFSRGSRRSKGSSPTRTSPAAVSTGRRAAASWAFMLTFGSTISCICSGD